MSIVNPTLAHFRHFSSLFTPSPLYICRDVSTNQILFMQNKPNFQKSQMSVNLYNTTDYENKWQRRVRKNKPNTNPIKPNLRKAKMNINSIIAKDYRKKDDFSVRINKPKTNPISGISKMNVNLYVINDYENETINRPKKTNPIQTQLEAWRNNDKLCTSSADTDEKSNTLVRTLGKCLKRRFLGEM